MREGWKDEGRRRGGGTRREILSKRQKGEDKKMSK